MTTLTLLTAALLAGSAPGSGRLVAVLDVEARAGASAELAKTVSDLVVTSVRQHAIGTRVISSSDIEDLVAFQKARERLGSNGTEALAKVGEAMGADEIVSGTLAILGDSYVLTLRRLDVKRSLAIHEGSVTQPRGNDGWLSGAVAQLVGEMFPPDAMALANEMSTFEPDVVEAAPPPRAPDFVQPSLQIAQPRPASRHSHLPSIISMSVGAALLVAAVVGTVQVVNFGNLKGQSNTQAVPISEGESAQSNAVWGGVLAIAGYPLGVAALTGGAVVW